MCISSLGGRVGGIVSGLHYVASKGGVISLVRWLARFGAPHGVRVNAVAPGFVLTEMSRDNIAPTDYCPLGQAAGAEVPSPAWASTVVGCPRGVAAAGGLGTVVMRTGRRGDGAGAVAENRSGLHLQRVAWGWVQQNLRADGRLVSGEELGRAFGRSARWGRYVKHAGHAGLLDEGS